MEQDIKQILETIFAASHTEVTEIVVEVLTNESKLLVSIQLKEASLFIGKKGDVLRSFDLLFRAYIQNKTQQRWIVDVDINNYKMEHYSKIKEMAKKAAHRALILKTPVRLDPMSAKDRRLVHSELTLYPDLISASEGVDPERCVIIKHI